MTDQDSIRQDIEKKMDLDMANPPKPNHKCDEMGSRLKSPRKK